MEQRSAEWLEARKGLLTASQVGAVLGNSPNGDRETVMRRMVREWHGAEPEFTGNIATEYGTHHEAGALAEYQMETGNPVQAVGFVRKEDWAGCSPDGLIGLVGGLEIKCPFGKRKMQAGDAFKPLSDQPHYHDQVQFSLWVCERAWWDFFQWASGATALETVKPCANWRAKNLPKLRQFYAEYLHEREHNAAVHLEPKRLVIDTPEARRLMAEYDDLTEAMERAEARRNEVKELIVGMANGRNASIAGRNVTKVEKAGAVSYAKAIAKYAPNADLEPFRGKPSSYWEVG
jgi:putative phage-type endonuclease